jgi:hypothetical protein
LDGHPAIKIVDVKQSASGGSFGASLWFISVWYEDGSEAAAPHDREAIRATER